MLFQSQPFLLVFLPATLALWFAAASRIALREWVLIACSALFYAWWDVRFLPLLGVQITVSWLIAEAHVRFDFKSRALLVVGIAANLAVLGFFKYWTFLGESLAAGFGVALPQMSVILPIGISFFTFEIVSYLVDLGWKGAPRYPLRRFALFVMLFPRLIAGPIVRHHEIIPQFDLSPLREGFHFRFAVGVTLLVLALVKKVFLADNLAPIADAAFASAATATPSLAVAWTGALAFTFQLFLDFSAYSEMAIGIALMLGFDLPANFNMPYRSLDLREFWRRWHITLSTYLRDYLYIPLGGSREGLGRYVFATLVTMALCGLWHGAGWTFIAWGVLHGFGLLVHRGWSALNRPLPMPAAWLLTFLFVVAGWVLFRAPTFATAAHMFEGLIGLQSVAPVSFEKNTLLLLAVAAAVSMIGPPLHKLVRSIPPHPLLAVATAALSVYIVLEVGADQPQSFIYFQF